MMMTLGLKSQMFMKMINKLPKETAQLLEIEQNYEKTKYI